QPPVPYVPRILQLLSLASSAISSLRVQTVHRDPDKGLGIQGRVRGGPVLAKACEAATAGHKRSFCHGHC
ncbi:hypothetical protein Tsubulata_018698, partial [Turnera subulata]